MITDELPEPPVIDDDRDLMEKLAMRFGKGPVRTARLAPRGPDIMTSDPVAERLFEAGLVIGQNREHTRLYIECPWKHMHSTDSGPSQTAWLVAGSGGFARGHFDCRHATCQAAGYGDVDFLNAVGLSMTNSFEALPGAGEMIADVASAKQVLDPRDTMGLGRAALRGAFFANGLPTLLRTGGLWYEHVGPSYLELSDEDVRGQVWNFLDASLRLDKAGNIISFRPTSPQVSATMDALRGVANLRAITLPSWIHGCTGPTPSEIVTLADGLLHVAGRKLLPHTPAFFSLNALPFAWGDEADQPEAWLAFLDDVFGGDEEQKATLQEMFGYLLTADTSQQKIFLILGAKRSGKGTIGRVLAGLLGPHNVAGPTLQSMTTQFGLEPIIGKLAAIIPDARSSSKMNTQAVVERLLMISGEDNITADRKGRTMWTGTLAARIVILTNEIPMLGDASGALAGRFIVLNTLQSFYGREDPGLTNRLLIELPAIFRWALDGRDRLAKRGHFVQPAGGREPLEDLAILNNPVAAFVAECCDLKPSGVTVIRDLFNVWKNWCQSTGRNYPGNEQVFGKNLNSAFRLRTYRPMCCDGVQRKAVCGLSIKPGFDSTSHAQLSASDSLT